MAHQVKLAKAEVQKDLALLETSTRSPGAEAEKGPNRHKSILLASKLILLILLTLSALFLFFTVADLSNSGVLLRHLRLSIPSLKPLIPSTVGEKALPARRIAVVVVLRDAAWAHEQYKLAMATLRCYAAVQGYALHYVYVQRDGAQYMKPNETAWHSAMIEKCYAGIDVQNEEAKNAFTGKFMFIRHCAVVELMLAHPEYEWLCVLDGDLGVADATHRLEKWIDDGADVIFYEREWNWEIMAGSYLVKNSAGGRRFLNAWFNTHSEHNQNLDNGALHLLFLRLFATQAEQDSCNRIYFGGTDLFPYTVCSRYVLNRHAINVSDHDYYYRNDALNITTKLLPHGLQWSRDANADVCIWWSPGRDFMLHGWKQWNQVPHPNNSQGGSAWSSPFTDTAENNGSIVLFASEEECQTEVESRGRDAAIDRFWRQRWRADVMVSREELEAQLGSVASGVAARYADVINGWKFYEI